MWSEDEAGAQGAALNFLNIAEKIIDKVDSEVGTRTHARVSLGDSRAGED